MIRRYAQIFNPSTNGIKLIDCILNALQKRGTMKAMKVKVQTFRIIKKQAVL